MVSMGRMHGEAGRREQGCEARVAGQVRSRIACRLEGSREDHRARHVRQRDGLAEEQEAFPLAHPQTCMRWVIECGKCGQP
jgi:hypothetical protein